MENKKRSFWERITGGVHVEEEYEEPKRNSVGANKGVQDKKNSNWIEEEVYDTGLSAGEYCVDYNSASLSLCASHRLYWDGTKYSHNTLGDATNFFRTVGISNQVDAEGIDYVQVSVTVDWDSREITAENHLYDWK